MICQYLFNSPSTYQSYIHPFISHIFTHLPIEWPHTFIHSFMYQWIHLSIDPSTPLLLHMIHPYMFITSYIHTSIHTFIVPFIDLSIIDWLIKIHTCNVRMYIQSLIQPFMIFLSMQSTVYSVTVLYSPLPTPVELIVTNILTQRVCLLQTLIQLHNHHVLRL